MTAAVYARYSSENQRPESIDDQVSACRKLAKLQSLAVPDDHIYADQAQSGARSDRPALAALMAAARAGEFQVVLVDDLSRLARDNHLMLSIIAELHFEGIRVISVAEANSFKPHVATYTKAAELLGLNMDQILFVANHAFDCIGAKSAGMRTAFIDRRARPFGETEHQPDILVPSMTALVDAIV